MNCGVFKQWAVPQQLQGTKCSRGLKMKNPNNVSQPHTVVSKSSGSTNLWVKLSQTVEQTQYSLSSVIYFLLLIRPRVEKAVFIIWHICWHIIIKASVLFFYIIVFNQFFPHCLFLFPSSSGPKLETNEVFCLRNKI